MKSSRVIRDSGTAKIEPMVARMASRENGSAHAPTRITPRAPSASTVRTMVPRLPGSRTSSSASQTSASPPAAGSGGSLQRCWKTPIIVCGLSLPESFSRTAALTSRHSAPAFKAPSTSPLAMPLVALPARNAKVWGVKPISRAVTMMEVPSATNSPVSLRVLRISSARIAFTRSLVRLVIGRGAEANVMARSRRSSARTRKSAAVASHRLPSAPVRRRRFGRAGPPWFQTPAPRMRARRRVWHRR